MVACYRPPTPGSGPMSGRAEKLMSRSSDTTEGAPAAAEAPFWTTKPLQAMTHEEWESLCDGCGQCCLLKVEEENTGDIYLTRLACRLLDTRSCRCRDYPNRRARVPACVTITPGNVGDIAWLPQSCAYRRVAEDAGWSGGIRWSRAIRKRCTRPASRCAAGPAAKRASARARSRALSSARPTEPERLPHSALWLGKTAVLELRGDHSLGDGVSSVLHCGRCDGRALFGRVCADPGRAGVPRRRLQPHDPRHRS